MKSLLKRSRAVAAVVAGTASVLTFAPAFGANTGTQSPRVASNAAAEAPHDADTAGPDFGPIVAKYGPAVVNVSVSGKNEGHAREWQFPQLDPNDPLFRWFKQFQGQMPPAPPSHGIGSGFIVSPDGIILTNAHVVAGASEVTVKLTDKREFTAKVVGVDKPTDIAVLKIDAHNLPTVRIGDATQTHAGEWAVAIGSPFGFENTVTAGIISAKSRSLPQQGYVQFIQTDVPVNPGNSGGPLFDLNGNVIGINSQIYGGTGAYEGISFAIPINTAMQVEQQLLAQGKVERGRLGITIQDVDQALAQDFGLQQPSGALISSVEPESPGARAGLKPGDVILKFDGHEIPDSTDLPPLVASVKPGSTATLSVWQKGKLNQVTVTVGGTPQATTLASSATGNGDAHLGLTVRPLTSEERSQDNVTSGGLMVESSSGPSAKAGIEPGDIVLSLDNAPVASAPQLRDLVRKSGRHVALLVQHQDARIYVPVDLG
jgi:serine protease Do